MSPTWNVSDFLIVPSLTSSLPLMTMSSTVVLYIGLRVSLTTAVREVVSMTTDVSTSASAYPLSNSVNCRKTRDESSLIRLSGPFFTNTTCLSISLFESSGVGWLMMTSETIVGGPSLMRKVTPTWFRPLDTTAVSTSASR